MVQQRKGRHDEKGECGEHREPIGRHDLLDIEDLCQRGQDERAGHEAGDVGVDNDEQAPVQLDLVGVDVARNLVQARLELLEVLLHA